jgi:threonine/homoserine/homoserine lactone efflux protein
VSVTGGDFLFSYGIGRNLGEFFFSAIFYVIGGIWGRFLFLFLRPFTTRVVRRRISTVFRRHLGVLFGGFTLYDTSGEASVCSLGDFGGF